MTGFNITKEWCAKNNSGLDCNVGGVACTREEFEEILEGRCAKNNSGLDCNVGGVACTREEFEEILEGRVVMLPVCDSKDKDVKK